MALFRALPSFGEVPACVKRGLRLCPAADHAAPGAASGSRDADRAADGVIDVPGTRMSGRVG